MITQNLLYLKMIFNFNLMDLQETFNRSLKVVLLDEATITKVAKDIDALTPAIVITGLFAMISSLGFMLFPPNIIPMFAYYRPSILTTLLSALSTFALLMATFFTLGFLLEKLFPSKLDRNGFVKVMGHGLLVGFVSIIPTLALLGWLWVFVILVFVLRNLAKLDLGAILLFLLFTLIVMGVFQAILGNLGLGAMDYRFDYSMFQHMKFMPNFI